MLEQLQVLDLGHDPGARATRILGDLGAHVVRVVPPSGDPLTGNVARAAARHHLEPHEHPYLGAGLYERNGFRIAGIASGYDRAVPTLGQDTDWVLRELLGLDGDEIARLRESGAVE
jgi:crotonobetainyl-CoA:carnitine CoA-transferase CaiB-like acyl-CoA transferase